eukprot:10506648-Karenia_brevis.AAC.1
MSKLRDIIGVVDSPENDPDNKRFLASQEQKKAYGRVEVDAKEKEEAAEEAVEEEADDEKLDEEALADAKDVERTIKACRWPE